MIPRDLLPWDAAYRWFRAWSADGTIDRVHDALREACRRRAGRETSPSAAVLDAQSVKSSEGGEQRGFDAGKKTTGRKRHVVVDTQGLLLTVMVTAASVQDRAEAGGREILRRLATLFPLVALVWADGGYGSPKGGGMETWTRENLGLVLEIVKRTDNLAGFKVLPRRWVVERTLGWLVRNRRLARDYERLTTNSENMIKLAMIRLMANRLTGQSARWSNTTERQATHQATNAA
jgi:transposase